MHTQEDRILVQLVGMYGQKDWGLIARHMPGKQRKGKQVRAVCECGEMSGVKCLWQLPS